MMRHRRRLMSPRLLFVAAVGTVALIAVPVGAQEQPVLGEDGGWYSSLSVRQGELVSDPLAVNTLVQGDLPVGASGTEEHKRSYLRLRLPDGALSATITLERSDSSGANFGSAGPILVCPLVGPFAVTTGNPLDEAPEVDCDTVQSAGTVPELESGVPDPAGDYTFDLAPLLAYWAEGDRETTIALVADVSTPQALYQVTFHAQPFTPVGTATVDGASSGDNDFSIDFIFPSDPGTAMGAEGFGGLGTNPGLTQMPMQDTSVQPPLFAAQTADEESAPVLASGPAPGLDPLPINPAVWLLLPLGIGTLVVSGRQLGAAGDPVTALDRLLRR